MRKVLSTIGVVIDTMGSLIIYALIALAILFVAGRAKHYYDVGYGILSRITPANMSREHTRSPRS